MNQGSITTPQRALRWSKRAHVQHYLRLLARLMRMGPAEVGQRLHLALRKRYRDWLRVRVFSPVLGNEVGCSSRFIEMLGPGLTEKVSGLFDKHFFFGPSQKAVMRSQIERCLPTAAKRVVELATAIENESVQILGLRVLLVPGELDWQADPVSKRRAWREDALDESEATSVTEADVKYVWEINRHQFLPLLGRAFWLTEDPRYARTAIALIEDWITHNPVGKGVNWSSHLEVGVRAISWLWTMPYLLACPDLDQHFLKRWLGSIADHYDHLRRNLSVFTDPTNHLIGEATALWMLSVCLPDLPDSQLQVSRALAILTREAERQVTSDGVDREHATSYHRFVLDFYVQLVVLLRRAGKPIPAIVEQRVQAMFEFVAALAGYHGQAPMIGDGDDARGLPFPELTGWDFRDTLSTGATLFQRGDWKTRAGGFAEVTLWLLGPRAVDTYNQLPPAVSVDSSPLFPEGGYCFFNNSSPSGEVELIFDVGPLGLWPNAAHGHANALNILIRVNGKFLLTDPGTGTYFGCRRTRDYFRQTGSHNTLTIDDIDQADIYDTFKWVNPMNVKLLESYIGKDLHYAAAVHDGYHRLRNPVTHYRSVCSIYPDGWVVVDRLEGKREHLCKRHFHFHPGTRLERQGAQSVIAMDPLSGSGLRFDFPELDDTRSSVLRLDGEGLWSDRYGHWQAAPRLEIETRCIPPLAMFTFIGPLFADGQSDPSRNPQSVSGSALADQQAFICGRASKRFDGLRTDTVVVNPTRRELTLSAGLRCNARFCFFQQAADGSINKAFIVGEGGQLAGWKFRLGCRRNERFAGYVRSMLIDD